MRSSPAAWLRICASVQSFIARVRFVGGLAASDRHGLVEHQSVDAEPHALAKCSARNQKIVSRATVNAP